ncbi:hypothetical protein BCV69DRAFT_298281 [Microstroma glucosiphilum]|uniref:Cation efflux protein n=1 Tax=Pseudomicrostroma glucosiphilum TaxID=1684307 RepID=A0A316U7W4_9BASI|nr:hypothetical protein BCV69DRAFT_298281 [Pseudomicrostroma glucosiphilum]PWN21252.1 hypothetical protein BCV69DRAFT_298281 [Pseudomicrostroma glucosiphilum]
MASPISSPSSPSKPPPLPSALHQQQQHQQQQQSQHQGLPTGAISAPSPPFGTSHNFNRPSWLINLPPGPKDTPTQSVRRKHKSVRSLTREYESSATKENLNPDTVDVEGSSAPRSADSSSPSKAAAASSDASSRSHARKSSVLLASSSYPSSFEVPSEQNGRTRPSPTARIPSGSGLPSSSSSEAGIRLASSAYPSTYSSATPPSAISPHPLPAPPPPAPSQHPGDMPVSQDGPPVFSVSLDSPHSPAAGQSALPTLETPTRLSVKNRSNSNLGRSVSHGHTPSREWPAAENATPERPRAVSAYDAAVKDEEGDTVGDLMRTQSTSARKPLSQMTPAERREHSRKHSRVHSRNLSVFFPQPGSAAEQEADQHRVDMNYSNDRPQIYVDTAGAQARSNDSEYWSTTPESASVQTSPSQSRRGHHSKHSVSHGIFRPPSGATPTRPGLYREDSSESFVSFAPNGSPEALKSRSTSVNASHDYPLHQSAHPHDHHGHTHQHHHQHAHTPHKEAVGKFAALPYPLSIFATLPPLPPKLAPTLVFSLCHFVLGSALWVAGQSSDSLSVTGLGYLVVFDSLGIFNESLSRWILAAKSSSTANTQKISSAYSMHRTSTLLNFVQVIYLLFAAVYVCKESIEHALLEGDDQAVISPLAATETAHLAAGSLAGSASVVTGGGAGHHQHEEGLEGLELNLPVVKIALAVLACLFSNLVLSNHAKLVAASGISTTTSSPGTTSRRHSRSQSVLVQTANLTGPVLSLLSNPYTMAVLFFSTTLLFSALTMSPFQVAALDKVLAGLESVTMWYIALPASRVLGKVLLQTAPNINNEDEGGRTNTLQLMKAIKALEDHPLVHSTKPPHVWQLTPSTSAVNAAAGGAKNSLALSSSSSSRTAKSPTLIASVRVILHKHATDADILKVTKWAYQRCAPSVGAGMGVKVGEGLRGTMLAGDLVLDVRREGEEAEETCGHDHHGHDHHGHGHDHSHAHSGHSHDHSHAHAGHGHDHTHDHARAHAHAHDHSHAHDHYGHSHEHDHYGHHVALAPQAQSHEHDHDHDHDHKGHANSGHSHGSASAHHHHSGHSHSHQGHASSAQQRIPSGHHVH